MLSVMTSQYPDAGRFVVIATDPEREWSIQIFTVRALSVEQAKEAVRCELTKDKRDHWSLSAERR